MAQQSFTCTVNNAGASVGGPETPDPQIYFNLTDTGGSFAGQWFFAANKAKQEMLAVTLAAVSTQSSVFVWLDPPVAGSSNLTQCYTMHIVNT